MRPVPTGPGWVRLEFRGVRHFYNDVPPAPNQSVATFVGSIMHIEITINQYRW